MRRACIGVLVVCASTAPALLRAQGVRNEIVNLFTFGTCGDLFCLADVPGGYGADFDAAAESEGQAVIDFMANAIDLAVANTPISSSTSGTTFQFQGIRPVATATSAGPIFAERGQPLGRNHWFVGLDFMQLPFRRLRGVPLSGLTFNYPSRDRGDSVTGVGLDTLGSPVTENDVVNVQTALNMDLVVASISVTYGLAYGVDIGFTIPFERLSVHGTSVAQIIPASGETVHYFDPKTATGLRNMLTATLTADGASTGLGDVEGHLKINLAQGGKIDVALFGSARFPTGESANFLGSGAFSGRGLGIVSGHFGNFNPHVNLGITLRDASNRNNSAEAVLGFDDLMSQWATIAVDVLSSWQLGPSHLRLPQTVLYQVPVPHTMSLSNIPNRRDDLVSFNFGFKFRTRRGVQIVTSALIPLLDTALQPTIAWTGGVEYAF